MTARPADVTLASVLTRSPEVLYQELGGEAVLLDLTSETYFGLNEVGTRIWSLLAQGTPLAMVHTALCEEFDAPADAIERDLLVLAARLCDAGLVTVAG